MENNAPVAAVQAKPSTSQFKENAMRILFIVCACVSILAVALICVFLFANGLPTIFEIGPLNFLLGTEWRPSNDIYGIFPMIVGSIYVTAGALIVGVPVGLLTAMYLSFFASERIKRSCCPPSSCWPASPPSSTVSSASWCWCPGSPLWPIPLTAAA